MVRNRPLLAAVVVAGLVLLLVAGWLVQRDDDSDESTQATVALSGSSGEVKIVRTPSGWEIHLDADLERLDGGEYYQAWLKDDAGTLVPIGTFNEGDDVTLWAGVSPLEFSQFTVTRESADNNQDSSGDRVLMGTITGEG